MYLWCRDCTRLVDFVGKRWFFALRGERKLGWSRNIQKTPYCQPWGIALFKRVNFMKVMPIFFPWCLLQSWVPIRKSLVEWRDIHRVTSILNQHASGFRQQCSNLTILPFLCHVIFVGLCLENRIVIQHCNVLYTKLTLVIWSQNVHSTKPRVDTLCYFCFKYYC